MPTATPTFEDPTLKVLTLDIILGVRWYDIPRTDSLQRFRALQARHLAALAPRKAIIVSISNASGELHFDSGSRGLVEDLVSDSKSHLLGMAQIVIGDGFAAASVRAVLSGIQLAARPDYPVRVFANIQAAQPWLEELLIAADLPELARAVGPELLVPLEAPHATTTA